MPGEVPEPVRSAGAAFVTRDDDLDRTVGTVHEEHTVLGRQRHPVRPEPDRRRPRLLAVVAASAVVALGAGGVALLVGRGDGDPAVTPTTVSPSTTAAGDAAGVATSQRSQDSEAALAAPATSADPAPSSSGTTPVDPADLVPTNLHAWVSADDTLMLDWESPASTPPALVLWILFPGAQRQGPIPVPVAARTYEVVEIDDPSVPLCLMFTAPVLGPGDADPAESALECINGAELRAADGVVVTAAPASGTVAPSSP